MEGKTTNSFKTKQPKFQTETKCGWGCYPSFIQPLASKKSYVIVFGLLGAVHIAMGSYKVATLSTLERNFKISSKVSGLFSCALDIGTLFSTLIMSYVGSRGHKTRLVGFCTVITGLTCFGTALPYIIYGAEEDVIASSTRLQKSVNSSSLCGPGSLEDDEGCVEGGLLTPPVLILMVSHIMMGVSICMYWTVGVSYLDDNVKKNKVAFLWSMSVFIRMLGPIFGNLLASYALKLYVNPALTPNITSSDPRWVGAWWFGWIVFGFVNIVVAYMFSLFPRKLPQAAKREKASLKYSQPVDFDESRKMSMKDFLETLKRLLKNKLLMYNCLSGVCYAFGLMAYWTYMPKYIETQYRMTSSESSLVTGSVGLVSTAVGVLVSGGFISKVKPLPRTLAAWNVFVEILGVLGQISFGFIDCTKEDLHGSWKPDGTWNLFEDCNYNCHCGPDVKFEPICSFDKSMTFYSPCHAGCSNVTLIKGTKIYSNCSCIPNFGSATESYCPADCFTNFWIFIAILCAVNFFGSSGRAGNTIILFRSVSPKDKSISLGFSELLMCAITFIPAPIFFGALLDYTCIVWEQTCKGTGNCWLYDDRLSRYLLNFTSSGFLFGGALLDCAVWYYVKGLQIYDEEENKALSDVKNQVYQEQQEDQAMANLIKPTLQQKTDLDG